MKTVQFAFEIKWPLEAGHRFTIALLTEEGLSMPKKCSEIKMSQESLVDTGLWCVLFWYKLQQYFLYWSILFIIQRIAKVLLSDKRPLMISQLHRLWCFFAFVSQLTHFLLVKNHRKRCSCDVIKGHSYVVVTLKFKLLLVIIYINTIRAPL